MKPDLGTHLNAFLEKPNLARLATSRDDHPHVVPIWFLWEEGALWFSSYEATQKIHNLRGNRQCALVIDVQQADHGITGVLFEGEAEILKLDIDENRQRAERLYRKYLGEVGIQDREPQVWLNSPENRLIKITPVHQVIW